jgi:hypothetical protein
MYIAIAIVAVMIGWKYDMLPAALADMLNMYMPSPVANAVKGCGCNKKEEAAVPVGQLPPGSKCEDFRTETQCGLYPSMCEFMADKCRSRPLTPQEKGV